MWTGHTRGLTRGATDGALPYSSCRERGPPRTRTQRRKRRIKQQKNKKTKHSSHFTFFLGGMAAMRVLPTVVRKFIKWPLRRRRGKSLPLETRLHSETGK